MEYQIDLNSETWKGVKQIINSLIDRRKEALTADQSEIETAKLRGCIREMKQLLNDVERPTIKPHQ